MRYIVSSGLFVTHGEEINENESLKRYYIIVYTNHL